MPSDKIINAASGDKVEVRGVNSTGRGSWSNVATVPNPQVTLNFITGTYTSSGIEYLSFASYLAGASSTFARSGAGGYDLKMTQLFANNIARITSDGLLLEPTSTNYMLHNDFASGWNSERVTITANNAAGPTGVANSASTLREDNTASNNHQLSKFSMPYSISADPVALSIYAKRGTGTRGVQPFIFDSNFSSMSFATELATPFATGGGGGSPWDTIGTINNTFVAVNSFMRPWMTIKHTGGDSPTFSALLAMASSSSLALTYNGDNTSTLITACYQLEQVNGSATGWYATHPSSCIPVTTTAATRGADTFTLNLPSGVTSVVVTFDDDSTQTFSGLSAGNWAVPVTQLNRPLIKTLVGM